MEIQEEVVVVCKDQAQIMRGKRTKRQRTPSPLRLAIAMPSTSSSAGRTSTDCSGGFDLANTSSPATTSGELRDSTTEEEEDMANCLILLAQGKSSDPVAATKDGVYLYQCKTCERCFPSFQALGGHRASHKKLKPNPEEKQVGYDYCTSTALSLQLSNRASLYCGKSKVHECSVCGAEFSSGQALGGHMRRHRTFVNASTSTTSPVSQDAKKPRNVFKLDLNLPAPEDHDHTESKSPFHSKDTVLVFSTSPLVDCYY